MAAVPYKIPRNKKLNVPYTLSERAGSELDEEAIQRASRRPTAAQSYKELPRSRKIETFGQAAEASQRLSRINRKLREKKGR